MKFNLAKMQDIRGVAGIYFLYNTDELIYVGSSSDIYTRILEHKVEDKKIFTNFNASTVIKKDGYEFYIQLLELCIISILKPKENKLVIQDLWSWYTSLPIDFKKHIESYFFNDYKSLENRAYEIIDSIKLIHDKEM